jgi:hypothetical protein
MQKDTIKTAQKRLLSFCVRLALYDTLLIVYCSIYIFWFFAPALLAVCLSKTFFSFLCIGCISAFFINFKIASRALDMDVPVLGDALLEERRDLKFLIPEAKYVIQLLKDTNVEDCALYELGMLCDSLEKLGINSEWILSIIRTKELQTDIVFIDYRDDI